MRVSKPEATEIFMITMGYLDELGYVAHGQLSHWDDSCVRVLLKEKDSLSFCSIDIPIDKLEWHINAIVRDDGGESHRLKKIINIYDPESFMILRDVLGKMVKNSI